jgi:hypothetical protein
MAGPEAEVKLMRLRVPTSVWAIARYVLRTGRDTFTQGELKGAACGTLDTALALGLIVRLDNGLYKANMELARSLAGLLPKVPKSYITERKGRFRASEAKTPCEGRQEAVRLAKAWARLSNWAEVHAEDEEDLPKEILEVLEAHGIAVRRTALPNGAKVVLAKVLNMYIIMDDLMVKNTPKCVRYSRLGPDALLCASTKDKLYSYLAQLTTAQ